MFWYRSFDNNGFRDIQWRMCHSDAMVHVILNEALNKGQGHSF